MEIKYYEKINRLGRLSQYAKFNNIEFIFHDRYFVNYKYGRLHVYIYEFYNSKIEKGYEVHHKDENKMNNDISNLQLLTSSEHHKLHNTGKNHSLENNPMYGKNHSEETRKKQSEVLSGENNPHWIPITDEMINDYKSGIKYKDFLIKYSVSQHIWNKMRNGNY